MLPSVERRERKCRTHGISAERGDIGHFRIGPAAGSGALRHTVTPGA